MTQAVEKVTDFGMPALCPALGASQGHRVLGRTSNSTLYCVFIKEDNDGYRQLYYGKRTGTNSWFTKELTSVSYDQQQPEIYVDADDVKHIMWVGAGHSSTDETRITANYMTLDNNDAESSVEVVLDLAQDTFNFSLAVLSGPGNPWAVVANDEVITTETDVVVVQGDDGYINDNGSAFEDGSGAETLLRLGASGSDVYNAWARFPTVAVPQGQTLRTATLTIQSASSQSATLDIEVFFNDADDAAAPTTYADYNSKTTTTASATFSISSSWSSGEEVELDVTSVVQEVVNRGGWSSGNAMMALIKDNSSANSRICRSLDFTVPYATKLTLTFVASGDEISLKAYERTGTDTWEARKTIEAGTDTIASPSLVADNNSDLQLAYIVGAVSSGQWSSADVEWLKFDKDTYVTSSSQTIDTGENLGNGLPWDESSTNYDNNSPCVQLAIDSDDDAHVTWWKGGTPNQVMYRRQAGGTWQAEQTIDNTAGTNNTQPSIALDADDDVFIFYMSVNTSGGSEDLSMYYKQSSDNGSSFGSRIAVDSDVNACPMSLWRAHPSSNVPSSDQFVLAGVMDGSLAYTATTDGELSAGWLVNSPTNWTVEIAAVDDAKFSGRVLRLIAASSLSTNSDIKLRVAASEGEVWSAGAWYKVLVDPFDIRGEFHLDFLDSGFSTLDSNSNTSLNDTSYAETKIENVTAPANTAWVELQLVADTDIIGSGTGVVWDGIRLYKAASVPGWGVNPEDNFVASGNFDDFRIVASETEAFTGEEDERGQVSEITPEDLATLDITSYEPFFGGTTIDLSFDLRMTHWKEVISTKPTVLANPGFENTAIDLSQIEFQIEVKGYLAPFHKAHPLTTGVTHHPDFVDLEEAALLWNKESPGQKVKLSITLEGTARTYEGVIETMTIVENGGMFQQEFILRFRVAWNQSRPALREWN